MIVNTEIQSSKRTGLRPILLGVVAAVVLAGCSERIRSHGYAPSTEQLSEIQLGVDTRDTVSETIGAPSSSGVLNEGGYYYVSSKIRHYGARKPEVVAREVVAINFSSTGTVTGVQKYSLQDGRVVPLQRRVTDSSIQDKTFLRQLLGNVGNFDPGSFIQ